MRAHVLIKLLLQNERAIRNSSVYLPQKDGYQPAGY